MDFDNEIERVSFFCVDKMLGGEIFNLFCLSCFFLKFLLLSM